MESNKTKIRIETILICNPFKRHSLNRKSKLESIPTGNYIYRNVLNVELFKNFNRAYIYYCKNWIQLNFF